MNDFVTIHRFTYQHEALTILSLLEAEGIEAVMQDQLMAQVMPLYSNALGGIKLQVRESDAEAAIEILKQAGIKPEEPDEPGEVEKLLEDALIKIPPHQRAKYYALMIAAMIVSGLLLAALIYYLLLPHQF